MFFARRTLLRALPLTFGSTLLFRGKESFAMSESVEHTPQSELSKFETPSSAARETVAGIGGFFFRSRDPKALSQWYKEHLGVLPSPTTANEKVWEQEAGPTVFSAFPETTKYFGNPEKMWMINFRVRNMDRIVAQLKAAQIEVKVLPPEEGVGKFAHLNDPEGNPIELWEPA